MTNFFTNIFNKLIELVPNSFLEKFLYLKFYTRETEEYTQYLRNILKIYSKGYINKFLKYDLQYYFFSKWADAKLVYRDNNFHQPIIKTAIYFKYSLSPKSPKQNFAMYNNYCRFMNIELKSIYSRKTFIKEYIQMDLEINEKQFLELENKDKPFLLNNFPELFDKNNGPEVKIEPVSFDKFAIYMKIFKQNCKNNSKFIWQNNTLYLSNFELLEEN